jgi:CRISPR-associated endonuclease Cas2
MPEPVRLYLILYDISKPKRWRRVYRALSACGAWAQLSAFFCRLPPSRRDRLEAELRRAIDPETDRLLVVDLGDAERAPQRISALGAIEIPTAPHALII